jgi:sec-independent protein translocase protein TatA
MFRSFGPMEIGLVLLIILIIFGVGKLPQVGGAIGKGLREFRKASHGDFEEKESPAKEPTIQASNQVQLTDKATKS